MIRVALKGMASRPLRTFLTTLAIVLGVGMVSAAFTLTDTMRGAANSLSSAAYDGTDAVVSAKTAFKVDSASDSTVQKPTVAASVLDEVRAVPQVGAAVGDISDQALIMGRDGKPVGDGPYFGTGFDSRRARRREADRLPPAGRALGDRPRRGRHRRLDGRQAATTRVGDRVKISTRGAASSFRGGGRRALRHGQVARHRDRRGVRPRDRAGAVQEAGPLRLDPGRGPLRHRRRPTSAARSRPRSGTTPRSRRRRRTTASRSTA